MIPPAPMRIVLVPPSGGPARCIVTTNMTDYFEGLASSAEQAMLDLFANFTESDALKELEILQHRRLASAQGDATDQQP